MSWRRRLAKIGALFCRRKPVDDLQDEIRSHLAMEERENLEAGMPPDEAHYAALRRFGNVTQTQERSREMWGWQWIETLLQDLRYGLRQLRRNPGFTAVAILTLGLGIGVNVAVFSALDAVTLRPLAVPETSRVVVVHRGESSRFSYRDYVDYRDRNQAFSALAATFPTEATLGFEGQSDLITAEAVSTNYEAVMRMPLLIGHWFTNEDEPEAIISYRAWVARFDSDPRVLGKQVRSISSWYTIVGVAPPDFTGIFAPKPTDLWIPLRFWAKQFPAIWKRLHDSSNQTVMMFGRLRGGVTPQQAAANLNGIFAQIQKRKSERFSTPLAVTPVRGAPDSGNRDMLLPMIELFAAVAGLVLLIACVNIGNLLLARGSRRQRELAVRVALGASRVRVLRQLMTESFLLAILGSMGGLILGAWTDRALERLRPPLPIPVSLRLSVDIRVIAFTLAVTLATMLLFGLLPAWRSARTDVYPTLKGEATPRHQFRLRQVSLVAQVAISLLLLLCAGLFLRSILGLAAVNPGFATQNRLYAWTFVSAPEFTPETGREFYTHAVEKLRSIPGVRNAALTHFLALTANEGSDCVSNGKEPAFHAAHGTTGPGYFRTMKIPLLEGRDFSEADVSGGPAVVIVNETLAQRLWPHQSATGRKILIGCQKPSAATVIGVARDSRTLSLAEAPHAYFYRPFSQHYTGLATIVVQTQGDPRAMMPTVRRTLLDASKNIRIYALNTVAHQVEQSYWQTRWAASLLVIFGLLALGLAAVGLHGVITCWVSLRTHDIGIRMALGAERRDVLKMVVGQGLKLALIGVAIGIVGALALTRFLSSLLYGIKPTDPITFITVSLILIAVAFLACYIPARRAANVDPMVALRYE